MNEETIIGPNPCWSCGGEYGSHSSTCPETHPPTRPGTTHTKSSEEKYLSNETPIAPGQLREQTGLTFSALRKANIDRDTNEGGWHEIGNWTLSDWGVAVAGEVGEMLNVIKKIRRGDFKLEQVRDDIADELADILTYLDLLANCAGIDVEQSLIRKFNEVSARIGSQVLLGSEVRAPQTPTATPRKEKEAGTPTVAEG